MRQIGQLDSENDARRFVDYLLIQGIEGRADSDEGRWAIWVRDEKHFERSKTELAAFRQQPLDPRYASAGKEAEALRRQEAAKIKQQNKNLIMVRDRWSSRAAARTPVTLLLIMISVGVTMWADFGKNREVDAKVFISSLGVIQDNGEIVPTLVQIRSGEVWRLVSPIFLHFSILHLVFNMWWLHSLGGMLESRYGALRFILFVLVIAVISNLAQYFYAGPHGGGMSGVVYGLFGYVWIKSRFDPGSGIWISRENIYLMIGWLFLCMTGWIGPIGDGAHAAGLGVGMIVGYLASLRMPWQ